MALPEPESVPRMTGALMVKNVHDRIGIKAILLGIGLSALTGWTGVKISQDFSTGGAIFYLFPIVSLLNPLLRTLRREWALSSRELAFVHGMPVCASATVMCYAHYWPAVLTAPVYFANPENRWEGPSSPT